MRASATLFEIHEGRLATFVLGIGGSRLLANKGRKYHLLKAVGSCRYWLSLKSLLNNSNSWWSTRSRSEVLAFVEFSEDSNNDIFQFGGKKSEEERNFASSCSRADNYTLKGLAPRD